MPRGIDSRLRAERQVGPGSSLHQQIKALQASNDYLFGVDPGTQDDGASTSKRPTVGAVAPYEGHYEAFAGDRNSGQRPAFMGAEPNKVRLAQMRVNHDAAFAGLMQQPNDNAPMGNLKMVDRGMREGDGKEHPVHTWIDETIKLKKD